MRWANSRREEFEDRLPGGRRKPCGKALDARCRKAFELAWRGMTGEVVQAIARRCREHSAEPSRMFAWMIQRLPKILAQSWCPPVTLQPLPAGVREIQWGRTKRVASMLSAILANLKVNR